MTIEGGCLCGQIRYRVSVAPTDTGYCHCRICQRASGAPAVAYANIPIAGFVYVSGEPRIYRSSANGERRFCPTCGTPLEYSDAVDAECVGLNTATLDAPAEMPPGKHIFAANAISWDRIGDDLPIFPASSG